MSLPRFLDRAYAAAGPLLGGLDQGEMGQRLKDTSVVLEMNEQCAEQPGQQAGYLLAANLAARLYPRLGFDAPSGLADAAVALARSINPGCLIGPPRGQSATISWNGGEPAASRVAVAVEGWNLALDHPEPSAGPAAPPAAMAAAALAVGELFRAVFGPELRYGRSDPAPFAMNLVTLGEPDDVPDLPETIELGRFHLAGCGAIGQAAVATLREVPAAGTIVAVDHDEIDLGNLQRYLLSTDRDERAAKPGLIERALKGHPLRVEPVATLWGTDERTAPGQDTVLSALDSKQGRVELQAGLPRQLFNAWTQPEDLGVSRHQAFGSEPCLACLAWPTRPLPSDSELIAESLDESELRVIRYHAHEIPVGQPLPAVCIQATGRLPLPPEAKRWGERSLLDDLIERKELPAGEFARFRTHLLPQFYRDVVCASVLLQQPGAQRARDVSVPLAHQSALAGILLATWLLVDRVEELRAVRPSATQARYDVLRGGVQIWPRPRERLDRCLCSDPDFLDAYAARWPGLGHRPSIPT